MKAYFISGLAADKSIFKHIALPGHFVPVYIEWIAPHPDESLGSYAIRLMSSIDRSEKFVLIGLSMGGMLAVEIAKHTPPEKVILISSIPSSGHLPGYYRKLGKIGIQHLIPVSFIQYATLLKRFFTNESLSDKKHLKQMIRNSDPVFIKWALKAILEWENDFIPEHLIHIHGSIDGVLPHRYTTPTHLIVGGGHLMVITKANEINRILYHELAG